MSYSAAELKPLKVAELRAICTKHGLEATGKKEELIDRITKNALKIQISKDSSKDSTANGEVFGDAQLTKSDQLKDLATPDVDPIGANSDGLAELLDEHPDSKATLQAPELTDDHESLLLEDALKTSDISKKLPPVSSVDEEEKRRKRAERFGLIPISTNLNPLTTKKPLNVEEELEKRRKRAERFGGVIEDTKPASIAPIAKIGHQLASSLSAVSAITEEEKIRRRAERFGVVTTSTCVVKRKGSDKVTPQTVATATTERGLTEEEKQKLEARAKRFKLNSTTQLSKSTTSSEDAEKLAKRAERFGINKS